MRYPKSVAQQPEAMWLVAVKLRPLRRFVKRVAPGARIRKVGRGYIVSRFQLALKART